MYDPAMLDGGLIEVELPVGGSLRAIRMLDCNGKDQVAMKVGATGWSSFESPMPEIFWRVVAASAGVVVDVGANTGYYTLLAVAARKSGTVWAIEPDPKVLPVLWKNLRLNHVHGRMKLFRVALSDVRGKAELFVPTQEHGLVETSSSLERDFRPPHSEVIPTRVTTLDALVFGWANVLRKVSVVKIDVEGHEAQVFRGAERTIKKHRPVIFVEILRRSDFTYFNRFIQEYEYIDFRLLPDGSMVEGKHVDFDLQAWNHVLIPKEDRATFISVTQRVEPARTAD